MISAALRDVDEDAQGRIRRKNLVLPSEQNIGESEQDMKISYSDKSNLIRFLVIVW